MQDTTRSALIRINSAISPQFLLPTLHIVLILFALHGIWAEPQRKLTDASGAEILLPQSFLQNFPGSDTLEFFVSRYPNGAIKEIYTYKTDSLGLEKQREGLWRYYLENSRLSSERMYHNGLKDGFSRIYSSDGALSMEFQYERNRLQGLEKHWYSNGQLQSEKPYKNNKAHGTEKQWNQRGQLIAEIPWHYGQRHGRAFEYFGFNGAIKTVTPYKRGDKHGEERGFNQDGQLIRTTPWRNGVKQGTEEIWHKPGTLAFRGLWRKGKAHGWHRWWNTYGVLERKELFREDQALQSLETDPVDVRTFSDSSLVAKLGKTGVDGTQNNLDATESTTASSLPAVPDSILQRFKVPQLPPDSDGVVRVWKEDSILVSETQTAEGRWNGEHRLYRKGKLFIRLHYRNDTLHGSSCMYFRNGMPKECIPYEKGKIQGIVQTWYPGGELKGEYNYRNSKRIGIAKGYYPDGQPRFELSYIGNAKNGVQRTWHPNGQLKAEINWVLGDLEGQKIHYDSTGSVLMNATFKNNVCIAGDCDMELNEKQDPFEVE